VDGIIPAGLDARDRRLDAIVGNIEKAAAEIAAS